MLPSNIRAYQLFEDNRQSVELAFLVQVGRSLSKWIIFYFFFILIHFGTEGITKVNGVTVGTEKKNETLSGKTFHRSFSAKISIFQAKSLQKNALGTQEISTLNL